MRVTIKKWGHSAAVRIPSGIMQTTNLQLDAAMDIREEGGCIIIEPIRPNLYDIDQLVDSITPENLHAKVDFGTAVGKEIL